MSKAVLISIRPKWCELMARGEKTIEVRKTRPKIETPFKCYIYCTKPSKAYQTICGCMVLNSDELYRHPRHGIRHGDSIELMVEDDYTADNFLNGKVIGEFVCDRIFSIEPLKKEPPNLGGNRIEEYSKLGYRDCLTDEDFAKYVGLHNGKTMCGWHISNLVIYDEPMELSDFMKPCNPDPDGIPLCLQCKRLMENYGCGGTILRPPQSWCYVEELT